MRRRAASALAAPANDAAALAPAREESGVWPIVYTQADLDRARDAIIAAENGMALSTWKLGQELLRVKTLGLWQLRTDAEGKPAYKGFNAFVRTECRLRHAMASYAMTVAEKYSEAQVLRHGVTKLLLLEEAPEEDRPALREQLETGEIKSKRELEKKVRKANAEKKARTRHHDDVRRPASKLPNPPAPAQVETPPAPEQQPAPQPPQPRPSVKVPDALMQVGQPIKVPLFSGRNLKARANDLADAPFGRLTFAEDGELALYISVQPDEDGLVLYLQTVREEPTP